MVKVLDHDLLGQLDIVNDEVGRSHLDYADHLVIGELFVGAVQGIKPRAFACNIESTFNQVLSGLVHLCVCIRFSPVNIFQDGSDPNGNDDGASVMPLALKYPNSLVRYQ